MHETVHDISGEGDTFLNKVIFHIRDRLGTNWFRFGQCLKIHLDELHRLEDKYYHNYEMCTSRMLSKWRETKGAEATWDVIVIALRDIGETGLSQQLEKQYKLNLPPAASSYGPNVSAGKIISIT